MMKKLISFLLCSVAIFIAAGSAIAQNKGKIDSLEKELKRDQSDTQKVNIYNTLAEKYKYTNPDKQLEYAHRGLNLAKKINFQTGMANGYTVLGLAYESQGRFTAAERYYDSSYTIWKKTENVRGQAKMSLNIANVHVKQADYPGAIEYTLKSLKLQEGIHDTFGVAVCKFTMGNIYYYQKNTKGALRQYLDAWQMNRSADNNLEFEAVVLSNIGGMFSELNQHDSSLYYYQIALKNFESHGMESRYASSLNNIGSIWRKKGNLDSALVYHRKALFFNRKMKHPEGIVNTLISLGNDFSDLSKQDSALFYYTSAFELAKGIGMRDKELEACFELSKTYKTTGDFKKALEFSERYIELNDSIHGDEQNNSVERLKKAYELDKKDQELRISEAETQASEDRNSRNTAIFVGAGFVALLVIAIILLMFRTKQKHNHVLARKNSEISQQKEEITSSITYAKKIQEAILPLKEDIGMSLPESFVIWIPRDIVSGDFYWFTRRGDKICIACVDCTGHGVPGALMSMIGNTLLNEIVLEKEIIQPDQVLDMLHTRIRLVLKQENAHLDSAQQGMTMQDGMDIAFCVIDRNKGELQYAGANRPVYIISNGTITEASPDKQPIGGSEVDLHKPFTLRNFTINRGDSIYMFSDGYADQFGGEKGKKFMSRRFQDLLLSVQDKSMYDQQRLLTEHFMKWKSGHEQVDDVLVIGFKI